MGVGNEPGDLEAALFSLPSPTDYVNEFRLARCECGSVEFRFHADYNEEVCRRTCVKGRVKH
jgi:hypothetical protein